MNKEQRRRLEYLFGNYRAEQLPESFGTLFIMPPYLGKLERTIPAFLFGGRGTGKTTALKSLCREVLENTDDTGRPYLGVYMRINKNRVRAFDNPRQQKQLSRAFAHYLNLLLCAELCRLGVWLETKCTKQSGPKENTVAIARSLCVRDVSSYSELHAAIQEALRELEVYVNNIETERVAAPLLSIPEAAVAMIAQSIHALDPQKRVIFCCIDEYENLSGSQQAIANTYIKHAEPPLSYKVGLKANGLHSRDTIDAGDPLVTPADFEEINLTEECTPDFLRDIVARRVLQARDEGISLPAELDTLLPAMPFSEEATRLGAGRIADQVRASLSGSLKQWAANVPDHELYFLEFWAQAQEKKPEEMARDWIEHPTVWADRLGNYGFASLFWLSRGRKGARIRKYYAGVDTLLSLASGNVRYFLELVDSSLRRAADSATEEVRTTVEQQTQAATTVATKRIDQIDGVSERGGELKRLVLAVGKVLFELTRRPEGRTPEPTMFVLSGDSDSISEVTGLLKEGVVHLAFESTPRTKATSQVEMQDDEYRLHPILAPFFEISNRRKRRVTFDAKALCEIQTNPRGAMQKLLKGVEVSPEDELPFQMALFAEFFAQ